MQDNKVKKVREYSQGSAVCCRPGISCCMALICSSALSLMFVAVMNYQVSARNMIKGNTINKNITPQDDFVINHFDDTKKKLPNIKITKSAGSKNKFNWSDLPSWQSLPKDHFTNYGDNILSNETANSAARSLYDMAYTKLLVGDLDEAETGFLRILQHYPSSDIASKAEKALDEVASMRLQENDDNLGGHKSSIEQLLIISGIGDFQNKKAETPKEKKQKSAKLKKDFAITTDGVLKGSYEDFIINIGDRVFFENRSAKLTKKAKELLKAQIEWLKLHKDINFLIEGHSDEEGSDDYNMTLSANRAGNVQSFFLNEGIDPGRIKTRHFGKKQPIATCRKEKCLKQNRRAITRLLPTSTKLGKEIIKKASVK